MILKGSQRGNGKNLAVHLLRVDDNEHVHLHQLRGFVAETLVGAFKEAEAISLGTKCSQYLFSLSLSPPADARVPVEEFEKTLETVETRLGLVGQPRAVVFHEKEGRRHAHCVWSRIDAETMKARPLPFFKRRLMDISRELYLEHGWKMPDGFADPLRRDPTNFTLAEWQQAKRQGVDPRWIKLSVQECWNASDGAKAFGRSLEERGYFLARGDRRDFVIVDYSGEVYSLSRLLGLKAKDVRAKLGNCDSQLGVEETRQRVGERMTPPLRRHIEEIRVKFNERFDPLARRKTDMTARHRAERAELTDRFDAEWQVETLARAKRMPRGLRGLWYRVTGRHSEIRRQNEREAEATRARQAAESQRLVQDQLVQRASLQIEIKELRAEHATQLRELRREIGWFVRVRRDDGAHARDQNPFTFTRKR
jgi:hypothetical protein